MILDDEPGYVPEQTEAPEPRPKARRGFAAMSPEQRRAIASKGGRRAHQKGTAYEWSSQQAADAGRRGGLNTQDKRRKARAEGKAVV